MDGWGWGDLYSESRVAQKLCTQQVRPVSQVSDS